MSNSNNRSPPPNLVISKCFTKFINKYKRIFSFNVVPSSINIFPRTFFYPKIYISNAANKLIKLPSLLCKICSPSQCIYKFICFYYTP